VSGVTVMASLEARAVRTGANTLKEPSDPITEVAPNT